MRTAELYYIHSLLEPDEIIRTGNRKKYKELPKKIFPNPYPIITEEEDNRQQDEYLKKHGVC